MTPDQKLVLLSLGVVATFKAALFGSIWYANRHAKTVKAKYDPEKIPVNA